MYRPSFSRLILFLALGAILHACTPPQSSALETETLTLSASATPIIVTTSIAEIQNSAEFIEHIRIQAPGSDSRIVSPVLLEVLVSPPSAGFLRIELTSLTGTLLARQIFSIRDSQGESAELSVPINFEINRPTLNAQLIASIEDEHGRLKALNSVAITLLSDGATNLESNSIENQIEITSPNAEETVSGGTITISGQAGSRPGRALNIELITRDGRVLGFGEAYPSFEEGGESGTFSLTLDYEVEEPTWVLIGVAEREGGFIIHYASQEVLLLR